MADKTEELRAGNVLEDKHALLIRIIVFSVMASLFWVNRHHFAFKIHSSQSGSKEAKNDFPVCADAANVNVTEERPVRKQTVREDCLSGIVRLPLGVRFISDASGWAEYWFVTPGGYKTYRVEDLGVNFPKTILPSSTFRMRGKSGMARIQIENRD